MHVKAFANRPGASEVQQTIIRRVHACTDSGGEVFEHLLRTDLINNKNSTVVKMGTYNANVLSVVSKLSDSKRIYC